jgi:hypothetical protein
LKYSGFALAAILLAACTFARSDTTAKSGDPLAATATQAPTIETPSLPDLGPAPELTNEVWLNTEAPLRLADLRGRVILLEMWTYG